MAITFCHQAALLSVIEEGENHWHVNKVLGEVADELWRCGLTCTATKGEPASDTLAWRLCLEGSESTNHRTVGSCRSSCKPHRQVPH